MSDSETRLAGDALLSDEPTIELVLKARNGDRTAVEALLQRCLPKLRRWAHGRLPAHAREALDTGDLVQEAALHMLQRVDDFEPHHVGAMQAYLRLSVINRIRDEIRRVGRRPVAVELVEEPPADAPSPLEVTLQNESYDRYRTALERLASRPRAGCRTDRSAVELRRGRRALRNDDRGCRAHGGQPRAQAARDRNPPGAMIVHAPSRVES